MKNLSIISRYALGIFFLLGGVAGLLGKVPPPEPEAAQTYMSILFSSKILFIVKSLEILAAIALLSNLFVPAALFVLAPIIFNILWFHVMLDPSGLPVGIVFTFLWFLTAYSHKNIFLLFLKAK